MRGRGEKEERKELYPLPHRLAESLRNKAQPGNDPGVDALFSKTEKKKKNTHEQIGCRDIAPPARSMPSCMLLHVGPWPFFVVLFLLLVACF